MNPSTSSIPAQAPARGLGSIAILALGTFAVGTDAFIVSGFLPSIAHALQSSNSLAGLSVTVFATTYALLAPVLATLTAPWPRNRVLVWALAILAAANLASALAPDIWILLASRALAAMGAAAYTPTATAAAGSLVRPELRGRAFSMVTGGLTVATALGVPLGNLVSQWLGWRAALGMVAALSALAGAGVFLIMPPMPGQPRAPLRARLAVLRRPAVAWVLPLTLIGMTACYIVYAYSVPALQALGVADERMGLMLLCYGIGAVLGNLLAGYGADRWGPARMSVAAYVVMAATFGLMSWLAAAGGGPGFVVGLLVLAWGFSSWGQTPPQQLRLTNAAPQEAPLVMALNASCIYFGIGLGTALGAALLVHGMVVGFGISALAAAGALGFLGLTMRRRG
ncbi:MFS transporter [Pigmentiphaga sp. NML080357]|uniref:MFS transporter n=1 Tax=Pigmentiphaga sp. NML080357 TaxID=2008675 RepID=UPI0018E91EEB|nr:MFS transporter [Pigmentiphaga sp. NML080357]